MALLIWKIFGYGLLLFFVFGIVAKIFDGIAPILRLILFIGFSLLAIATFPLVLLIRTAGYRQCSSLFPSWKTFFGTHSQHRHERTQQQESNGQKSSKVDEETRHAKQKAPHFDPWAILEVPRNASKQEIKTAYRKKVGLNHPDKVASLDPALQTFATERTVLLQKAYEQLVDAT